MNGIPPRVPTPREEIGEVGHAERPLCHREGHRGLLGRTAEAALHPTRPPEKGREGAGGEGVVGRQWDDKAPSIREGQARTGLGDKGSERLDRNSHACEEAGRQPPHLAHSREAKEAEGRIGGSGVGEGEHRVDWVQRGETSRKESRRKLHPRRRHTAAVARAEREGREDGRCRHWRCHHFPAYRDVGREESLSKRKVEEEGMRGRGGAWQLSFLGRGRTGGWEGLLEQGAQEAHGSHPMESACVLLQGQQTDTSL